MYSTNMVKPGIGNVQNELQPPHHKILTDKPQAND